MKKATLLISALALVFGLSQCKKPSMPVVNGGDVTKQHVELSASYNNGSKVGVEDMLDGILKLTWESTDSLFVYDGTGFCGCLKFKPGSLSDEGKKAAFEGDLDVHGTPTKMYFYYYGKSITDKIKNEEMSADNVTVNFSEQDGAIPSVKNNIVIKGEDNYNVENKYGAEMKVQFAIAKLAFKGFTSDTDITVTGISSCGFTVNAAGSLTPNTVTSMALTEPVAETAFYTVFMEKNVSTKYTFTTGTLSANLQATFENNKFYTKDASGEAKLLTASQPEGRLSGKFSVAAGKQVYFSIGNLQYLGSGADGNSSPIWRFAEHQYDYLGAGPTSATFGGNVTIAGYTSGTETTHEKGYNTGSDKPGAARDFFGWGTSGIEGYTPIAIYHNPYNTGEENNKYNAYGYTTKNLYDGDGDAKGKADWGYNAISNGGNTQNSGWRTLTKDEYGYLLGPGNPGTTCRTSSTIGTNENARFAMIKIEYETGKYANGLLLFPDVFTWNTETMGDVPQNINKYDSKTFDSYTAAQFAKIEAAGAAFLPASGYRGGVTFYNVNEDCRYWSSTHYVAPNLCRAYYLKAVPGNVSPKANDGDREVARPVRLVVDVK